MNTDKGYETEMTQFYVYLHCRPNGEPFYVGKGCDRGRDKRSHKFSIRNQHHKNIVSKCGGKENIEVLVFPRASEPESFDEEIKWIRVLRENGYALANKTDGGEGVSNPADEVRMKIANSQRGNKHCLGIIRTAEEKKKTSEAQKNKPKNWSAEGYLNVKKNQFKKGQQAHNKGKPPSTLSRAKMSVSQQGNKNASGKRTPEQCAKMSASAIISNQRRKKCQPL